MRRVCGARAAVLVGITTAVLAVVALLGTPGDARAQGFGFNGSDRVPREHDTDIGANSTGDPAIDYVLHCQGCHQAAGSGLAGAVPALKGSVSRIVAAPGGREYVTRVPGVAQSQLDDAAVARLLNWIVVYFDSEHLPADFRPFTAEEIAAGRRSPLVQASQARAALRLDEKSAASKATSHPH